MIAIIKYRLVKLKDRYEVPKWDNMEGLIMAPVVSDLCRFEPEVFDTVEQAEFSRELKDYPDDYIIITCF